MRSVIVMFDSLNRHMLKNYDCDWTHTPNFQRLAARTATFDRSYVCSMPCMPARRDLHTGRPNFLHRSWGPLEPFDDSVPELLKNAGIHTHLSTDHQHYWEDGGGTYHTRFSTYDLIRGQEGDPWIGQVDKPAIPDRAIPRSEPMVLQDAINRQETQKPEKFPMHVTFDKGIEFIQRNQAADDWMLQIETFDPHEPFFSQEAFRAPYKAHFDQYGGKPVEWPPYREVRESANIIEHARHEYASLMNGCDQRLGKVLDLFDELNLWEDTMLIVCTDHGFMLGEHDCWAKCWAPFYNEIANTPFFIWDPRSPSSAGTRRQALVQPSIDIGPTLLGFHGLSPTDDMLGFDLERTIAEDQQVRDYGIFGIFGGHVNITDGHYVYMCGPAEAENQPLNEYTLMPTHMNRRFSPEELRQVKELAPPFSFTKECPTLMIPTSYGLPGNEDTPLRLPTQLFDLKSDPQQIMPLQNAALEKQFRQALSAELQRCNAPVEQYQRLNLEP
ncbi:sulfatase [Coraliomargarita sp. SDUM461004]|uniref:Sulfatase n=1 Tax=Thalassobacterium sedimentorum TaxID=3041258 RepID=A0ABU1AIT5_9BACT|nr:sulfatase [Coraliomargarita sp. SDUM461004]MDQ8194683.1 sulfatase [Coraliomargarita sp. SDUM461004]